MKKNIKVLHKEEACSFDELKELYCLTGNEKIKEMAQGVEGTKDSQSVFFMPEAAFKTLNLFMQYKTFSLPSIQEIQNIIKVLEEAEEKISENYRNLLLKKMNTLLAFLKNGNAVVPVVIEADELIPMEIEVQ